MASLLLLFPPASVPCYLILKNDCGGAVRGARFWVAARIYGKRCILKLNLVRYPAFLALHEAAECAFLDFDFLLSTLKRRDS